MTRSALHLVSSVLGGLGALAVLGVLGPGLLLLAGRPLRIVALTVPLFTVVTLMWAVLSLIATGVDSTLDPARFSVLPLRAPELARGLLAAALTGIPAVMLCGLALAQAGAWATRPAAVVAALVAAVLGVLTAVLLSRAVTSALARVMTSRGGRVAGAVVVALVTLVPLGLNLLLTTGSLAADLSTFDATRSATVASWTPFGWAWGLPFDVATGRWASAAVHLVLAVGFVLALHAVWVRQLEADPHRTADELGRPADRARPAAARRAGNLADGDHRRPAGAGVVPRQPAGRHRPAHGGASRVLRRAGGRHRRPRAGWRRHRHARGVRRADADERPRLRRAGLVAARRGRGPRLGGPARPGAGLDRRLRPGRAADLRREPGARGHLEPASLAHRRRRRLLRQRRPGRRGGGRAAGHGAAHRWQPVRGDLRWCGPGLPHRHRVVRRADPAHPAGGAPRRRDRRQPDRTVGGPRRRHGLRPGPARPRGGARRAADRPPGARAARASSPPPRSDAPPAPPFSPDPGTFTSARRTVPG